MPLCLWLEPDIIWLRLLVEVSPTTMGTMEENKSNVLPYLDFIW